MENPAAAPLSDLIAAAEALGPSTVAWLKSPAAAARLTEVAFPPEMDALDRVLLLLWPSLVEASPLREEFAAWLLRELRSHPLAGVRDLGPVTDEEDVTTSVLGDFYARLNRVEFRGRRPLFALLGRRLGWKRDSKYRWRNAGRRQEGRRQDLSSGAADQLAARTLPRTDILDAREFLDRLTDKDRLLLERFAQGWTSAEVGREVGLEAGTARKRLQRLRRRFEAWRRDA